MDIDLMEKVLLAVQEGGRLPQEFLHQDFLTGRGGIDGDDQVLDLSGLPVLILLDQGHVAVDFHAIVIETVVKGIQVYGRLLPDDGEFLQELPVIRAAPGREIQDPFQRALLIRGFLAHYIQFRPDPVGVLLPFIFSGTDPAQMPGILPAVLPLLLILRRLPVFIRRRLGRLPVFALLILHPLPEAVVIILEFPFQPVQPVEILLLGLKIMIEPFRRQDLDLLLQVLIDAGPEIRDRSFDRRILHGIQDRFRRDITAEVPQLRILLFLGREHVTEQAVQDHMDIAAVQEPGLLDIHFEQISRVEAYEVRVRSHRRRGQVQLVIQTVQGNSHETHGQIQLCPAVIQDLFARFFQLFPGRCHRFYTPFTIDRPEQS